MFKGNGACEWECKKVSERFLHTARLTELYLEEVREKVKNNPSYERILDEHLAKFYVYNCLHGRTFLASKEELISELKSMLANPMSTSEAYDSKRFARFYCRYVKSLLEEFQGLDT